MTPANRRRVRSFCPAVVGVFPFPLDLADPSRFHAQPGEARASREQSDGDRADSDRDLFLGEAGQANHECHQAGGQQNKPGRLHAVLHRFAGAWLRRPVMINRVARGVSHADRLPGSGSEKTALPTSRRRGRRNRPTARAWTARPRAGSRPDRVSSQSASRRDSAHRTTVG